MRCRRAASSSSEPGLRTFATTPLRHCEVHAEVVDPPPPVGTAGTGIGNRLAVLLGGSTPGPHRRPAPWRSRRRHALAVLAHGAPTLPRCGAATPLLGTSPRGS